MTPEELSQTIVDSLASLNSRGALTLRDGVPSTVVVERPKVKAHGDYATNVALQLAKSAGVAPREFAELLAKELRQSSAVSAVDIAGPGFINITVGACRSRRRGAGDRRGRVVVWQLRPARRAPDQPGVRVRQPDRPGPHRRRTLGSGR